MFYSTYLAYLLIGLLELTWILYQMEKLKLQLLDARCCLVILLYIDRYFSCHVHPVPCQSQTIQVNPIIINLHY